MQYIFLHIKVDKHKWCPYNIQYAFSFHKTLTEAINRGSKFLGKDYEKKKINLQFMQSVWIDNKNYESKSGNGDHYQIIKLYYDKHILLNKFCLQVQSKFWFKK